MSDRSISTEHSAKLLRDAMNWLAMDALLWHDAEEHGKPHPRQRGEHAEGGLGKKW